MSRIAVIVEGPSDRGFIEGLMERLSKRCEVYTMRGNRPEKVRRLLGAIGEVDRVLVLKDLHEGGEAIREGLRALETLAPRVRIITVRKCLESWILAGFCVENPEETPDPEGELRALLRRAGRYPSKTPEFYRKLAGEVDIERAAVKSRSFSEFLEALGH